MICLLVLLCSVICAKAQEKLTVACLAFYNLENLFDTLDNTLINDEEFLPNGPRNYNGRIYFDKLDKLATVISEIGTEINADGPAILGVAEVENDTVLNDLVKHKLIKDRGYKIVHYDSKDARGIDVGLLYNPKYFTVEASDKLYVQLPGGSKDAYYTRDILWVKGKIDGDVCEVTEDEFISHNLPTIDKGVKITYTFHACLW